MDASTTTATNKHRPAKRQSSWRRFINNYQYVTAINLMCALTLTFLLDNGKHFVENVLASILVGTLAFLIINGVGSLFWKQSKPPKLAFLMVAALAVLVAQVGGMTWFNWVWSNRLPSLNVIGSARTLGLGLFTLSVCAAASIFFYSREQISQLEAKAADERARAELVARQALQAQLQMLQAQIEPHMLFNTLANLQGLIGFDPERAQRMLDHLIQYLRATLLTSRAETTTLGQEFALMEAYLGLMSVRMGQRLSYALHLPAALRDTVLPPMLLQPLVENAIQHGLEPKIDGGNIDVSAELAGAMLRLTVTDSGLGLDQPQPAKNGTHVAVSNIRERLLALYGDAAALTLENGQSGGATAQLILPLKTA
jgi:sensor histidine kinase YesM